MITKLKEDINKSLKIPKVLSELVYIEEEQTTQWQKEEEQTTQWQKEEEQTTQRQKEEEQTTQ